ncbi:hypothetical protein FJW07_17745 [Mesorhizobium sp. B3-1-9]|nr:hypothetical protein FJW07_17745 [Mesorhizobium sp. B3-1-9]TPI52769.1 hypothetical protein FJ417_26775 [Mesorhizobium sp. B3-1-7]
MERRALLGARETLHRASCDACNEPIHHPPAPGSHPKRSRPDRSFRLFRRNSGRKTASHFSWNCSRS